jgi:hypothetical protein
MFKYLFEKLKLNKITKLSSVILFNFSKFEIKNLVNKIKYLKLAKITRLSLVILFFLVMVGVGWWVFWGREGVREARADYLRVTETADYFHVQSGTYGIRVYKTSSDSYFTLYNGSGSAITEGYFMSPLMRAVNGDFAAMFDTNRSAALQENSPSRAVLKINGKFDQTYGATSNYLTDGSTYLDI